MEIYCPSPGSAAAPGTGDGPSGGGAGGAATRPLLLEFHAATVSGTTPLLPFQQLMAVLPPASAHALPPCYGKLMTAAGAGAASPVADMYPTDFAFDPNGEKMPWKVQRERASERGG